MRTDALSVAVAQPETVGHDVAANARAHAAAIRAAGARLVVFPELSLTGYELDADAIAPTDAALAQIVEACRDAGAVALVGAPVQEAGEEYIAAFRVDASGVEVAARKTWLHGTESVRFAAGEGASTIDVDGWRVGVAICRDTNISRHAQQLAHEGIDLYVAGVLDTPGEEQERAARSFLTARALRVPVAIASCIGGTTLYPRTNGGSAIYDADGRELVKATDDDVFVGVVLSA